MKSAIAIAAHPDDIEFQMAVTWLLLKQAGWETHYLNLSTGNCGSAEFSPAKTRAVRRKEAQAAARVLGAHWHAPICDDLEILYEVRRLRQVSAVIRETKASIVLTHSPQDYMEDHTNTCRLAVTAAFTHGMPNFRSVPARAVYHGDVTVYHAMPHGLRDGLRRRIIPGAFVDTTAVQATKLAALACHQSQQGWLDLSQGLNSYLQTMEDQSRELGRMSRQFTHAEGWRRHSHLGFCAENADPLREALGAAFRVNSAYEKGLEAER
ncbi:hypothetical protein LBMAG56_29200 [Verrucomicrobiota bacterium]|nr:hypothetical protein LBMAG56_29200 [Verrucomicrobiota bacterium]